MMHLLTIKNFKALRNETLPMERLTVFTGSNSSGKSTALLALFIAHAHKLDQLHYITPRLRPLLPFGAPEATEGEISICYNDGSVQTVLMNRGIITRPSSPPKRNCFFLCAERIGPRAVHETDLDNRLDLFGRLAVHYFETNKVKLLPSELVYPGTSSETLATQVNYWLRYIVDATLRTCREDAHVLAFFSHADGPYVSPLSMGFGTSTLLPVILTCLAAQPGALVIIENPEIHLHPRAQARLADFFRFIARAGIQVVLETHGEALLANLCSHASEEQANADDLVFHYKEHASKPFVTIRGDASGVFRTEDGEPANFPAVFCEGSLPDQFSNQE